MKFYGNLLAEAEFFHADRWTDEQTDRQTDRHHESNSRFRKFFKLA